VTITDMELARAYINGQKVIDGFERRKASRQMQRIVLDRELERRRAKRFHQREESADKVIFGEFREAAE
jgi:riboflavin biosynthesis pyrimidine reductase